MAKFDATNPGEARASQDVVAAMRSGSKDGGVSTGRGGGGNMVVEGAEERKRDKPRQESGSWSDRGREMLGKLKRTGEGG